MSLSDCSECWETPCSCGHEYKNMTPASRLKIAVAILAGKDDEVLAAKKLLNGLTDSEREYVFLDYCTYCGCNNPRCQCWNDE